MAFSPVSTSIFIVLEHLYLDVMLSLMVHTIYVTSFCETLNVYFWQFFNAFSPLFSIKNKDISSRPVAFSVKQWQPIKLILYIGSISWPGTSWHITTKRYWNQTYSPCSQYWRQAISWINTESTTNLNIIAYDIDTFFNENHIISISVEIYFYRNNLLPLLGFPGRISIY